MDVKGDERTLPSKMGCAIIEEEELELIIELVIHVYPLVHLPHLKAKASRDLAHAIMPESDC